MLARKAEIENFHCVDIFALVSLTVFGLTGFSYGQDSRPSTGGSARALSRDTPGESPLKIPLVMRFCAQNCITMAKEGDKELVNYTNLPGQRDEKRVFTIKLFTPSSVIIHRQDFGSFPGTADYTGAMEVGNGAVHGNGWRITWGDALESQPGSNLERDNPRALAQQRLAILDLVLSTAPDSDVDIIRWNCAGGVEPDLVRKSLAKGLDYAPAALDYCVAALTRGAREGRLPQLYGKILNDEKFHGDPSVWATGIGLAARHNLGKVSIAKDGSERLKITPSLAWDAGFTAAALKPGSDPTPMTAAALKKVTEDCLDEREDQPDTKTCFEAGYAQGAKAVGQPTYRYRYGDEAAQEAAEAKEEEALVARELTAERQDLFSVLTPPNDSSDSRIKGIDLACALGKGPEILRYAREKGYAIEGSYWRQEFGGIDPADLCLTALTRAAQAHVAPGVYGDLIARQKSYDDLADKRISDEERTEISKTSGHLAHDVAAAVSRNQSTVAIGSGAQASMKITPAIAFNAGFVMNSETHDLLDSQTLAKMNPEVIRATAGKCLDRHANPGPELLNCLAVGYALGAKALAQEPAAPPKSLSNAVVLLLQLQLTYAEFELRDWPMLLQLP